jgi:hypothetical protein
LLSFLQPEDSSIAAVSTVAAPMRVIEERVVKRPSLSCSVKVVQETGAHPVATRKAPQDFA